MYHGLQDAPTPDSLRCFLAAARHLNFRRAAEEVALTPAAFGQRIRQMEERLGHPLFVRTTRQVQLTRPGMALVPVARETLASARRCIEVVREGEEPQVSLVLGTRFELGLSWLVPSLLPFEESHPTWSIHLDFSAGPDILRRLEAGEVDAIVTSAPTARSYWTAEYLHPEHYCFVAAPELLTRTPLTSPEDTEHHTLLDVDSSLPLARYLLDGSGTTMSFGAIRSCGAAAAMLVLLRYGRGVAVMPRYMVAEDLAVGRLVEPLPEVELLTDSFRLIYRRDHPLSQAFTRLAEHLRTMELT